MNSQMLTSKDGAELISFKLDGVEKIHQGQNCVDEKGKPYYSGQWTVLFPTVGKSKQNQTIINGKTYEMPINGFVKDMEFEPITNLNNFHSYVYRSNRKLIDKFPYEFSLYVTYRLDENKLTTIYKVVNEGDTAMPFGIGSIPAFAIDEEELEKGSYILEFSEEEEKVKFLSLCDGLIETEYGKNRMLNKRQIVIDPHTFDNNALVLKGIQNKRLTLKNRRLGKKLFTIDFEEFPYLAIWSRPGAPFICIEPWKTMPDSMTSSGVFRQKSSINLLSPSQSYECKYSVEFFN